jgi:hypothetical protein
MKIQYGDSDDAWIKFPEVVWEPSTVMGLWVSRPVTAEDRKAREALATGHFEVLDPLPNK